MYFIVESEKPFSQVVADLESAVKRNGFGVLYVHDLGATLRAKGVDLVEECKVFEVCNPVQASCVMKVDMRLNMALPCRISVYTEEKKTFIGFIRPRPMLEALSREPGLIKVAEEVEAAMERMAEEVR
ncbi:MAG: DUF302 domain-containing protein [Acidobacteriota bacterium]|jgi:uncharacterized protein (DUF302 family)|nr:DUF302 domain-containing protein [Acidobacteriota bacterium]